MRTSRRLKLPFLFLLAVLSFASHGSAADFERSLAEIQQSVRESSLAQGRDPSDSEREKLQTTFPKLKGKDFKITGEPTCDYNCIAWSVGITDQSLWPGHMDRFDEFYKAHGCLPAPSGTPLEKADVVLWAKNDEPTHACRRVPGGLFESKCGTNWRITHRLRDLEGRSYGKPYKGYLCGANGDLSSKLIQESLSLLPN